MFFFSDFGWALLLHVQKEIAPLFEAGTAAGPLKDHVFGVG